MTSADPQPPAKPAGLLLHSAGWYDVLVWLATGGRERALRQKLISLARLTPGEAVLDVGCGTGTLAIAAKRQVGPAGTVCALDASPEMIARAGKKARRAGVEVDFRLGAAQALPFGTGQFDAALSTIMLHHLPRSARVECVREMRRVLKPGGRVLAVDFAAAGAPTRSFIDRVHRRHGRVDFREIVAMLGGAGLRVLDSGAVGFRNLQFVLGTTGDAAQA